MRIIQTLVFLLSFGVLLAQEQNYNQEDISINKHIDGTLLMPSSNSNTLVIIIGGSGPTDRNGNQNFQKSNSLKKLSEAITAKGIASFRYDKRIVKQIKLQNIDPNIMFDDFITDAISVVDYFKKKNTVKNIYIIGHSQGSLVGMLASKDGVNGFISIAGSGKPIDETIQEQITLSAPSFEEPTKKVLDSLRAGKTTTEYPPELASVFNIGVQPFIINWMQYNPQKAIKALAIPCLIINGTKDLQVFEADAKLLKEANPKAQLNIIENMNHVLCTIKGDTTENYKSYNDSSTPINTELIDTIVSFIEKQ